MLSMASIDPLGNVTNFAYDPVSRLVQMTDSQVRRVGRRLIPNSVICLAYRPFLSETSR